MCEGIDDHTAGTQAHFPAAADDASAHLDPLFEVEQSRLLAHELHENGDDDVGIFFASFANGTQEPWKLNKC